jgi:hypothetical protein
MDVIRLMYDLKLPRRLNAIKLCRAASHVKWLKADETNVLVLRELEFYDLRFLPC